MNFPAATFRPSLTQYLLRFNPDVLPNTHLDYDDRESLKTEGRRVYWQKHGSAAIHRSELNTISWFARSYERHPEGHPTYREFVCGLREDYAGKLRAKYGPYRDCGVDPHSNLWEPNWVPATYIDGEEE